MRRQRGTDVEKAVSALWKDHMRAEFPARLRGGELAGVDMVTLDADIAGCVVTWRDDHGALDETRRQLLAGLLQDLDRVMPMLHESREREYFQRLGQIGELVRGAAGLGRG